METNKLPRPADWPKYMWKNHKVVAIFTGLTFCWLIGAVNNAYNADNPPQTEEKVVEKESAEEKIEKRREMTNEMKNEFDRLTEKSDLWTIANLKDTETFELFYDYFLTDSDYLEHEWDDNNTFNVNWIANFVNDKVDYAKDYNAIRDGYQGEYDYWLGVCKTFSAVFQILCTDRGFDCYTIWTNNQVYNLVSPDNDGFYQAFDCTWAESSETALIVQGGNVYYSNPYYGFNLIKSVEQGTHVLDDTCEFNTTEAIEAYSSVFE